MAKEELALNDEEVFNAEIVDDTPAPVPEADVRYLGSRVVGTYGDVSLVRHKFRMNLGAAQVELTPHPAEQIEGTQDRSIES